jgi:hypothetical protein
MSESVLELPRWSKRRWAYAIAGVLLLQVILVVGLGRRARPLPEHPIFRTTIRLAAGGVAETQILSVASREDPALLALPSLQGFSGRAWLAYPALNDEPPEEPEAPYWLALPESSLGASFSAFVSTNSFAPLLAAERPLPRLPRYEPSFPIEPVSAKSVLLVQGDLARRPLVTKFDLPAWPHSEILSNSVVQVLVDGDGLTVFTALLSQSGRPDADARALELASRARFQAVRQRRDLLTSGRLVFRWQTLPIATEMPTPIP